MNSAGVKGDADVVISPNSPEEKSDVMEIVKEICIWTKKEKDLDEEINSLREQLNKEPVVTDKDIMEQLHQYNDMKDAAQVVLGSVARIEEVSFAELHKRYNLEISDEP